MRTKITLLLSLFILLSACGKRSVANLATIYNRAAQQSDDTRNPVILIPGLLGSRLVDKDTNRVVWGAFGGGYANPSKWDGARLLALPMKKGVPLKDLKDNVVPVGVLDTVDVRLWGLPLHLRTYYNIISVLGSGGYRDEEIMKKMKLDYGKDHFTCFQFPYDFRRDVVEIAQQFDQYIKEKKVYVEAELKKRYGIEKDVKFDIVTHSHGGNVARYFLRYGGAEMGEDGPVGGLTWAGAQYVDKAVLIGPPNAGAVKALREVIYGRKIGPTLPRIPPAVAGTHVAGYQLLPRGRHGALIEDEDPSKRIKNILDPALWEKHGWGLANPDQDKVLSWLLPDVSDPKERRAIALDHQAKSLRRAQQLFDALDKPGTPPDHLKMILVVGDADPTESQASVNTETGEIKVTGFMPGDKTVTRASSLMDERLTGNWVPRLQSPIEWDRVIFIFNDHVGLTKDPAFADNILYELLESQ